MSPSVKLDEIIGALESAGSEYTHYLDKRTGEIVLVTDEDMTAAQENELISEYPDWQRDSILKAGEVFRDSKQLIQLPDQFDIHEYQIMEDFCIQFEDRDIDQELHRLIKGSGAFRRFKNAIHEMSVEKAWYEFKRTELEKIAIEWLDEHAIPHTGDDPVDISDASM